MVLQYAFYTLAHCTDFGDHLSVNKDGEDMVNIGAVMEYGATIKHPNGATIVIPARPFLHPVMEKYREQILQNYREAIRSAL